MDCVVASTGTTVLIRTEQAFLDLQEPWNRAYADDPDATIFLSWQWLKQLYERRAEPVCVLAYRPAGSMQFAAFLPLRRRLRLNKGRGRFTTEYRMAGNDWADHTGIVCEPMHEHGAIKAIVKRLATLGWNQCRWHSMRLSDSRKQLLFDELHAAGISMNLTPLSANRGKTDLECSPVIELPATVDAFHESLGGTTRRRVREMQQTVHDDANLIVRMATRQSLSDDLFRFNTLWQQRWHAMKRKTVEVLADKYALIVEQGVQHGHLVLWCLQQDDTVVAMIANYQDPIKRSVSFFVGARDTKFKKMQGERLLHVHAIEQAIIHGYRHYEFLRGDERFKFRLGAHAAQLVSVKLEPPEMSVQQQFLEPEDVVEALDRLRLFERRAPAKAVHRLYAQLLESAPGDHAVLMAYADYLQRHGQAAHATQIRQFLFGDDYQARDGSHQQQLKLCFA